MDDSNGNPSSAGAEAEKDYVFRFRLHEGETDPNAYEDPLLEVIRGLLADLSGTIVFTHKGRQVRVDGFRLLQEPDRQYEIFPEAKTQ